MMNGAQSRLAILQSNLDNLAFMPHGYCYLWKPGLVWLHVLSDGLTALAYFSIAVALIYFVRQSRDLPYPQIFQLFGAFIIACGLTHVMEIWTFWQPIYWVSGGLKSLTAIISLMTASQLIPVIPHALTIPSRSELEAAKVELEQQVRDRTQSLRLSEERWQLALRGNNDGIWDWNVQTNEVFFSSRWKEMLGFADGEISNHLDEWLKRLHPDDLGGVTQAIQDHFAKKTPFYVSEYRVQCKDGSYKWILDRGQALWDEAGNIIRMSGSHTDITERKQAELALQESEAKYHQLIDHMNAGFVVHAPDTHILQCNATACDLLGLSMDQMLGKVAIDPAWHFIREDGTVMPVEEYPVNRVLSTQMPLENYVLGINQGLQSRWVLVTAFPEFDVNHQLKQVIVTFIDISKLKQAETDLREMAGLLENVVTGISKLDAQGRYLYVNKAYANITGYQQEEMIGMLWQPTVHPNDLQKLVTAYHQMLQDGRVEVEAKGVRKDGSTFYKQVVMISTHDEQQQFVGHYCFMKDITDRKQAEEALEKELLRSKTLFNTSIDGIVVLNHQGNVVETSPSFAQMIGYTLEETLKLNTADWDAQWTREELKQIRECYIVNPVFETRHRRKDGSLYDVEISYSRVELDGEMMHFCICRDISKRKQAEEELRHQKEMFQAIVNYIPVMIAMFDAQGHIEFINPRLEQLLGWSLEDWQNRDILAECCPDPVYRQSVLEHMLAATGNWRDCTMLNATGQPLETSWANVRLSGGRYLGIGQDISERKHKEVALWQAMEAASSANRAKSTFLANMSHELRTPLNVILGFTQVMAHDVSLTPKQKEDLQTIRRSGDHLLSLINDVLDLSKIEAGRCTLEETGFDLISLLHALRTMMTERAKSKRLRLEFDIAPEVPQFVIADEQKLRQILLNLLSNAIKFTRQGSVTLRVKSQESADLGSPSTLCLQFEVIDTGVGIAANEQATIFDAFVQAEAGKKSIGGTGLGLTISRKLLELMNGEIAVRSIPNVGSTFTFTVPVCPISGIDIPPEQQDRLAIGLAPGQPHRRILVVDDQRENRLVLVRLLTQLGLEVREATNGQEAIHIWQNWQPDLTWMDIRMPGLDGYEATGQIRAMEHGQGSIIIALTAQASQSDRALALAAGCNDYISKPFREETLLLKLKEYLGLEFLYTESNALPSSLPVISFGSDEDLSTPLDPAVLADLPTEWLSALEEATMCGDDRAIVDLVSQLPAELTSLGAQLTELADRFQFEQILQLIQP